MKTMLTQISALVNLALEESGEDSFFKLVDGYLNWKITFPLFVKPVGFVRAQ